MHYDIELAMHIHDCMQCIWLYLAESKEAPLYNNIRGTHLLENLQYTNYNDPFCAGPFLVHHNMPQDQLTVVVLFLIRRRMLVDSFF